MKTITATPFTQNIIFMATAMVMTFFVSSCTRKISFLTSPVVPAAQGSVVIKKDKNKNYAIKLHISNLAEPSRLTPPRDAYVVWMIDENNTAKKMGQIKTSPNFLAKKLEAVFETVSAIKPRKLFITAEDDPNVESPGLLMVLTTDGL